MRKITVVGSDRMATLDDMALEHKLTIWDKGFDASADTYGEYITRSGAVWSPAIPNDEPLRLECEHFVECLRTGERPRTDGQRASGWCGCWRPCRPHLTPAAPRSRSAHPVGSGVGLSRRGLHANR